MADIKSESSTEILELEEQKVEGEGALRGSNFDEFLAGTVRRFPVLYDKSCKDFHERDVKDSAWQAVAREVGLMSGQEAEKQFRLLRDRYQRAKMAIHRKESSGKSQVAMVRVQARLSNMNFMLWLDEHIKPRTRVVSIRPNNKQISGIVDETVNRVEILDGSDCTSEVDSDIDFSTSPVANTMVPTRRKLSPIMLTPKVPKTTIHPRFSNGPKRQFTPEDETKHVQYETARDVSIMREADNDRHIISPEMQGNITVFRDSAQIFGDFVADQLRQLSREQAVEARYKISGIFYSLMQNSQIHENS